MEHKKPKRLFDRFSLAIILPTLLAIVLSFGSITFFIIPAFQKSFLSNKKEMIQELTNLTWNILNHYEDQAKQGNLSLFGAQRAAINEIRNIRYGAENKNYFFILDTTPRMIMHPYSPELENQKLSDYRDPDGLPLFMEIKSLVERQQSGFIHYTWQTKYDSKHPVSKLSFVKKFEGWQWIVGTGVFLDDIEQKTRQITKDLFIMAFANLLLFSTLLIFIASQSYKIEIRRRQAEEKLNLSRQKYKALAESATDPMLMIHANSIIYANRSLCSILGYSFEELKNIGVEEIFPSENAHSPSSKKLLQMGMNGQVPLEMMTKLRRKNGTTFDTELSFSQIEFGDQTALVMVVRGGEVADAYLPSTSKQLDLYSTLTRELGLGLIRVGAEENLPLLELTETARDLIGLEMTGQNADLFLIDFFANKNEVMEFQEILHSREKIYQQNIQFHGAQQGKLRTFSITLVESLNVSGETRYYDGLISEVTEQSRLDRERENLIVELQTSLLFLNQPIKFTLKNFVSCNLNTSIAEATRIMAQSKKSSILVQSDSGEMLGIITDMVLRERVLAQNLHYETPVYQVMSSPLIYIDESALIFEAVLLMQEKGIKHLVVRNGAGETVSIISNEELLHVHRYSTAFMLSQIREATSFEEILETQARIPRVVKSLTDSGAHAKNITRIITTISDEILEKIIEFTIEKMGDPPIPFAFISLGSEGRGEQTLVTDQDNAIIHEDVEEAMKEHVHSYFHDFGKMVCELLNEAGYAFCKGDIMAMNPKWCQPLSEWKNYFSKWVNEGTPQDLLEVSIFFDFRCVYGEDRFTRELRSHISDLVDSRGVFIQHLAQTALSFKPPLDFFGNIQADEELKENSFDIKKGINGIVGFARLYAIEGALESINTMQRIEELFATDVINKATYDELTEAYNFLMKLRFKHQVKMIDENRTPDNLITIDTLSHLEKIMLKKAFSQVVSIQKRLSYDFSGIA